LYVCQSNKDLREFSKPEILEFMAVTRFREEGGRNRMTIKKIKLYLNKRNKLPATQNKT